MRHLGGMWFPCPAFTLHARAYKVQESLLDVWHCTVTLEYRLVAGVLSFRCNQLAHNGKYIVLKYSLQAALWVLSCASTAASDCTINEVKFISSSFDRPVVSHRPVFLSHPLHYFFVRHFITLRAKHLKFYNLASVFHAV